MEFFNNFMQILPIIFYKLVYMSIVASIVGLIILTIKNIFKTKISPKWKSALWLVFVIMLIIPISIDTKISIYNVLPDEIEEIKNTSVIVKEEYEEKEEDYVRQVASIPPSGIEAIEKETDPQVKLSIINGYSNAKKFMNSKQNYDKSNIKNMILNIVCPVLWFICSTLLIIIYVISYIEFSKKVNKETEVSQRLKDIFEKAKNRSKVKKNIKLVNQEYISVPSIFGIFNIRILINSNIEELEDTEIEYIFMHELAHYKRKDNILNVIITILKNIYFFNPIVNILIKSLRRDMESSCDEIATAFDTEENKKIYCKTLVNMAVDKRNKILESTLCITDDKSNLENRINNVKLSEEFKKHRIAIAVFSILLILIIVPVFCTTRYGILSRIEKEITSKYGKIDSFYIKTTYHQFYDSNIYYMEDYMKEGEVTSIKSYKNQTRKDFSYINILENTSMFWSGEEDEETEKNYILIFCRNNRIGYLSYFGNFGMSLEDDGIFVKLLELYKINEDTKCIQETIDGKKCYKIAIKEDAKHFTDLYIDKETYLPIKEIGYELDEDGKKLEKREIEYEIIINQDIDKKIIRPNLEEFKIIQIYDQDEMWEEENIENLELKPISNTNKKAGEDLEEEFEILETEEFDERYFSKTDTKNIKYLKVPSYRIYEKITQRWENLRNLTREDFMFYDVYIVVNTDKSKTLNFKEKVYSIGEYKRNILLDIQNKNDENNNYQAILFVVKKENKNNISYDFLEAKNEINFKSEQYALDKTKENMDKIVECIENYTGIDTTGKLSQSGGYLENVIPNEFFSSRGKSIKETSSEPRTAWREILGYREQDDNRNFELFLDVDAETGEFISGKIILY